MTEERLHRLAVAPAAIYLLLFFVVPIVLVLAISFEGPQPWSNYGHIASTPVYLAVLAHTFEIGLGVTACVLILGYPLAYLLTTLPGRTAAIVLGLVVGVVCFFFVSVVKTKLGYDDSLDVFGVHCIGGIIGAIGTGILVAPYLGGVGLTDYTIKPGSASPGSYDMLAQVIIQAKTVAFTLLYSGIGSAILYKLIDLTIGLRVSVDAEREGLDIAEHGERAYNT